jgi:hypothetical protein
LLIAAEASTATPRAGPVTTGEASSSCRTVGVVRTALPVGAVSREPEARLVGHDVTR